MTDLLPVLDDVDTQDPEEVKHIVDQRKGQSVADAVIFGTEVVALCGFKWIPTRDPNRFPLCLSCKAVLEAMK